MALAATGLGDRGFIGMSRRGGQAIDGAALL